MKLQEIINSNFLTSNALITRVLPLLAFISVALSQLLIFAFVPSERVMGSVQRILYFHVGAAMATYLMVGILFLGSVFYLATKDETWDLIAGAAAAVAFLFASVVLVSGMIWGHAAWNTWWRWEPRLVSFLVLWLIFFSYLVLRLVTERDEKSRNYAAVLGVIAALNVPIVIFSIKLLDQSVQLHPEVVAQQGLRDWRYVFTLAVSSISVPLLGLWLWTLKLTNLLLKDKAINLTRVYGIYT